MDISIAQIDFSAPASRVGAADYCLHCRAWVKSRILVGFYSPNDPWQWVNLPCGCVAELGQCLKPEALAAVMLL